MSECANCGCNFKENGREWVRKNGKIDYFCFNCSSKKKPTDVSTNITEFYNYTIFTINSETPHCFQGKLQTEFDGHDFYYFETGTNERYGFRKEHIISILKSPIEKNHKSLNKDIKNLK